MTAAWLWLPCALALVAAGVLWLLRLDALKGEAGTRRATVYGRWALGLVVAAIALALMAGSA